MSTMKLPKATHDGVLRIGGLEIPCFVLEDGTRILSERGVMKSLGGTRGGSHWVRKREGGVGAELPVYLSARNLKPFVDNDLALAPFEKILFYPQGGNPAYGVKAEILPNVCNVWLKARDAGVLRGSQEHIAHKADILMRGLAHVGIIALVDEATGYQNVRARRALERILERFISRELVKWAKTFPDEFYEQLFRLRGWRYSEVESFRRPSVVGRWTNDIVYARLAPGVLDELRKKNPVNEKGRRKHKLFQWLTEDVGHPRLREHLAAVIALMKAAPNWAVFKRMVERALPRHGETQWLFDVDAELDDNAPAGSA